MPPLGSVVINKLERPDVVKALNNKVFLLPDEVNQLKSNMNMYNYILSNSYVVTLANRFVISGTYGELWTISAKVLGGTYRFADRSAISLNNLLKKCENKEDIHSQDDFFNKGIIDWHLLETKPSYTNYMAQFIPKSNKFQLQTLNVWYLVEASDDFEKYHQDFILLEDHCDSVVVCRTYKRDNTWVDLCYYVESDKLGIVIHTEGYEYLYDDVNGTSIGYYNFCSDIMSQFGL